MTGYNIINLADVLKIRDEVSQLKTEEEKRMAEKAVESINNSLSAFSCPQNPDVEMFLKHKAITFAEQGIAATYLVFAPYRGHPVLIGYFTLANKYIFISDKMIDSKSLRRRIDKFAERNEDLKGYQMSIPLIAQLSKNFLEGYNNLITGDELLKLACDKIAQIQIMISGKMTYVECEDKKCLIDFYTSNGFRALCQMLGWSPIQTKKSVMRDGVNPSLLSFYFFIQCNMRVLKRENEGIPYETRFITLIRLLQPSVYPLVYGTVKALRISFSHFVYVCATL